MSHKRLSNVPQLLCPQQWRHSCCCGNAQARAEKDAAARSARLTTVTESLSQTQADINETEAAIAEAQGQLDALPPLNDLRRRLEALRGEVEGQRTELVEARSRKANALMSSAERILKVIRHRVDGMKSINDINGYMASDLMIEKVRSIIDDLVELDDSVKADDLQGRVKSIQQDAVRQLKDKLELFADGDNIISLGKHRFNINTQPLDLTIVTRDDEMCMHLTGTKFFDEILDEEFLSTRPVWKQEVVSENESVYRGEFLAWKMYQAATAEKRLPN